MVDETKPKIVTSYPIHNGMVMIGMDKVCKVYARCVKCKQDMVVDVDYRRTRSFGTIKKFAKCQKCGLAVRL